MFKRTTNSQGDLFKGIDNNLSRRKSMMLSNKGGWHNVFYDEVTSQVDEQLFSHLYNDKNGRPNASIQRLVAMLVLKEGFGWSDEELYENCRFNLLIMRALGLMNFDEDVPSESTYYLFKREVLEEYDNGNDLMKACFKNITSKQINKHKVLGDKIRLDSKLINSNIALTGRLGLILEATRQFIIQVDLSVLADLLKQEDQELLTKLKNNSTDNITFPLKKKDKELLLVKLGLIIKLLLGWFPDKTASHYILLEQVYQQHYEQEDADNDQPPRPKANNSQLASDIQSPHDPQAGYRKKRGKTTKGYHGNVTETCVPENKVNLIVDIQTAPANVSETDFLQPAIEESEQVLKDGGVKQGGCGRIIKHASTDGGYHSNENLNKMMEADMPHWNMDKHKGSQLRYIISGNKDQLQVVEKDQEQLCEVEYDPTRDNEYKIIHSDGSRRYMTQDQVDNYLKLQQLKQNQRHEDRNIRANVEATIYQMFHRLLKNDKIKYRGLSQCHSYVLSRAMWVNFKRIAKNCIPNTTFLTIFTLQCVIISQMINNQFFQDFSKYKLNKE